MTKNKHKTVEEMKNSLKQVPLLHEDITRAVIGCAIEVSNELGAGFLESVYENAMIIALQQAGLNVVTQYPVKVFFRETCVGDFYADLFVENKVIVELKTVKTICGEHQAQLIHYLSALSGGGAQGPNSTYPRAPFSV